MARPDWEPNSYRDYFDYPELSEDNDAIQRPRETENCGQREDEEMESKKSRQGSESRFR